MRTWAGTAGRRCFLRSLAAPPIAWACAARADVASTTEPVEPPKVKDPAAITDQFQCAAKRYQIRFGSDSSGKAPLTEKLLLGWTNRYDKSGDSALFVWTAAGRPEVVAAFGRHSRQSGLRQTHEFQSLATSALHATRDGRAFWTPKRAGIVFAPIPGAPRPATTPDDRLDQMRSLAREFSATYCLTDDHQPLILRQEALYRYETIRPEVLDGALFTFVWIGPALLLLIEARPRDGKFAWQYAFARIENLYFSGLHKDKPVWGERITWNRDPSETFATVFDADKRS